MKINWRQKLSSRKFWAAIIGVTVPLCVAFGVPDVTVEQITATVTAVGALVAYIFAESYVDSKRGEK